MVVSNDVSGTQGWKQLVPRARLDGENKLEVLMPELSLGKQYRIMYFTVENLANELSVIPTS